MDYSKLEDALGYRFTDLNLLRLALKHKSAGKPNNQRLEFLGDAILGAVIADYFYAQKLSADEGVMTSARATVVNGDTLAKIADGLEVKQYLELGKGERQQLDEFKTSILEDAFEALVGAIFVDSNFDIAKRVTLNILAEDLDRSLNHSVRKDPKTALQELLQKHKLALPTYEVINASGPQHKPVFKVRCAIEWQNIVAEGVGSSRKKAETQAAEAVLQKIPPTLGTLDGK